MLWACGAGTTVCRSSATLSALGGAGARTGYWAHCVPLPSGRVVWEKASWVACGAGTWTCALRRVLSVPTPPLGSQFSDVVPGLSHSRKASSGPGTLYAYRLRFA